MRRTGDILETQKYQKPILRKRESKKNVLRPKSHRGHFGPRVFAAVLTRSRALLFRATESCRHAD